MALLLGFMTPPAVRDTGKAEARATSRQTTERAAPNSIKRARECWGSARVVDSPFFSGHYRGEPWADRAFRCAIMVYARAPVPDACPDRTAATTTTSPSSLRAPARRVRGDGALGRRARHPHDPRGPARGLAAPPNPGRGDRVGSGEPRRGGAGVGPASRRSEEHTSELQSRLHLVCRLLLEKKKKEDTELTRVSTRAV